MDCSGTATEVRYGTKHHSGNFVSTPATGVQAAVLVARPDTAESDLAVHLRWMESIVSEQACNRKAAVLIESVQLNGSNTDRDPTISTTDCVHTFPAKALLAICFVKLSWKLSVTSRIQHPATPGFNRLAGASVERPGFCTTVNSNDLRSPVAVTACIVIHFIFGGNEVPDLSIVIAVASTSCVGYVRGSDTHHLRAGNVHNV